MVEYNPGAGSGGASGYVNPGTYGQTQMYLGSTFSTVNAPQWASVDQEVNLLNQMYASGDMEGYQNLVNLVKKAGFSSFEEALLGASLDPEKETRSWEEYLQFRAQDPGIQAWLKEYGPEEPGGNGADGPFRYSTTTSTISPESAAATDIDTVFQAELGRRATDAEIRAYTKLLNKQQAANPQTTVQSGTQSGNNRNTNSSTTGGFDPARFAMEYAQSQPEYAENFAATTFMSVLDRAISSPNALDDIASGR